MCLILPFKKEIAVLKNNDSNTEKEWVVSLQRGSATAFAKIFESYSPKLYRFAFSYLKNEGEAEDVVQEVFLKIWQNRSSLKSENSFHSYLFTIAFNAIRKNFNKKALRQKFQVGVFEELINENSALEDHRNFEALLEKLNRLIEDMPPRRKEIFLKRKLEGKSIHVIASEMAISIKTVENQITEAMNFLRISFLNEKTTGDMLLFTLIFLKNPGKE